MPSRLSSLDEEQAFRLKAALGNGIDVMVHKWGGALRQITADEKGKEMIEWVNGALELIHYLHVSICRIFNPFLIFKRLREILLMLFYKHVRAAQKCTLFRFVCAFDFLHNK